MIRILYFASVRETLNCAEEQIVLPDGINDVQSLRDYLGTRGGIWSDKLTQDRMIKIAVNQEIASNDRPIKTGDEIAFFPPVTGG